MQVGKFEFGQFFTCAFLWVALVGVVQVKWNIVVSHVSEISEILRVYLRIIC